MNHRRPCTTSSRWRTRGPLRRSSPAPPPASTSGRWASRAWGWQRASSSHPPSPPPTLLTTRLIFSLSRSILIITIRTSSSYRPIICQILTTAECLTMGAMSTISMFRYGVNQIFIHWSTEAKYLYIFFAAKFYPNPALWTEQRARETILQECLLSSSPRASPRPGYLPPLPGQPSLFRECRAESEQRVRRFANLQSGGKSKLPFLLRELHSHHWRAPGQRPELPPLLLRPPPPGHWREQRQLRALGHPWRRLVREDFWRPLQRILIKKNLNNLL